MNRGLTAVQLALAALIPLVPACGDPSQGPAGVTYRDSAGIRIAVIGEHAEPVRYALSPVPRFSAGGSDASAESILFNVTGGARLSDGRVVVASSGTHDLKVFDSEGTLEQTVGRQGEGPGEFDGITWLALMPGDSILTYDWSQARLQLFDNRLALGRVIVLNPSSGQQPVGVEAIGAYPDGRLLGRASELLQSYPREALQRHVFTLSQTGELLDSIGPFPGGRRIWVGTEPWPPFPREAAFVPWRDLLYTAMSEQNEFQRVSPVDGRVESIVRGGLDTRPPTDQDTDAAMAGRPPIGRGEPWLSPSLPYWSKFLVDESGMTWRRRYQDPAATVAHWFIVSPDATTVATLETRLSFMPLQIGEDWILAVEKDDLDVERVVIYGLLRDGN